MFSADPPTAELLRRWQDGDSASLDALLERHLSWIQSQVHFRLGRKLRGKADTGDYVQDALVHFLRYGPRIRVREDTSFRALMARIVENTLRGKHRWFTARRREMALEQSLPPDSVLDLDLGTQHSESPSAIVNRREEREWFRLGLELLGPADREVILLHQSDQMTFPAIAEATGWTEEAARKRFKRAMRRLIRIVDLLQRGELESVLAKDVGAA